MKDLNHLHFFRQRSPYEKAQPNFFQREREEMRREEMRREEMRREEIRREEIRREEIRREEIRREEIRREEIRREEIRREEMRRQEEMREKVMKEQLEEEKRRKQQEYNKKVAEAERREAERIKKLEILEEQKRIERINISNIRKNRLKNQLERQASILSDKNIIQNYKIRVNERAFNEIPVPEEILQKGREIFINETLKVVTNFINSQKEFLEFMNGYEIDTINEMIVFKQIQMYLNTNINNIFNIVFNRYEKELGKRWFSVNVQKESVKINRPQPPRDSDNNKMEIDEDL
jgi:hypothetical protein